MFIFGGNDGREYLNELNFLNLSTLEWMNVQVGGQAPSPRGHHTTIFCDSRLFVFAGADEKSEFNDLYILELGVNAYLELRPAKLC